MKRALQIKMVKTDPKESTTPTEEDVDFGDKVITLTAAAEILIRKLGAAALGYVVLDTLRQVVIARAAKS